MGPNPVRWKVNAKPSPVLPLAVVVFALICRLADFSSNSITGDEVAAKDSGPWWDLLKQGDFMSDGWGYAKPALAIMRWIYGVIPQALFGDVPASPHDMLGARLIAAVLSSILVLVVFYIGRRLGGASVGGVAALVYSLFPAVLGHDRFASHDLPSRLASAVALYYMVCHFQDGRRREWWFSAAWAGVSFAAYFRTGLQTILILQTALGWRWLWRQEWRRVETAFRLMSFTVVSAAAGFLVFTATWPYTWGHPLEAFLEAFAQPTGIAQSGGNMEWFFGVIRQVPYYYYFVIYAVMMPATVLVALLAGFRQSAGEALRGEAPVLLWLFVLVPLVLSSFLFRAALNHYLLICYPPTCLLAALGIVWISNQLARWRLSARTWLIAVGGIVMVSEATIVVRIHPYQLEFFNVLVGGTRSVARNHTFMTGWYSEGITPLFEYVNRYAPPQASVICRTAAWPGVADLRSYLRKDLLLQGFTAVNPLGADYILRVGIETCDQFYRCNPDPNRYEKVMDVLAMGGSIGDVWKRRDDALVSGPLYADDFLTPQFARFAVAAQNANLNPFSDGKLFAVEAGKPAIVLQRFPARLLGQRRFLSVEVDAQSREGWVRVLAGDHPDRLREVAQAERFSGTLKGSRFEVKPGRDLFVALVWATKHRWDGSPKSFWDYDWVDALRIYGK